MGEPGGPSYGELGWGGAENLLSKTLARPHLLSLGAPGDIFAPWAHRLPHQTVTPMPAGSEQPLTVTSFCLCPGPAAPTHSQGRGGTSLPERPGVSGCLWEGLGGASTLWRRHRAPSLPSPGEALSAVRSGSILRPRGQPEVGVGRTVDSQIALSPPCGQSAEGPRLGLWPFSPPKNGATWGSRPLLHLGPKGLGASGAHWLAVPTPAKA